MKEYWKQKGRNKYVQEKILFKDLATDWLHC